MHWLTLYGSKWVDSVGFKLAQTDSRLQKRNKKPVVVSSAKEDIVFLYNYF